MGRHNIELCAELGSPEILNGRNRETEVHGGYTATGSEILNEC
jgi:hypothetical protein